MDLLERFRLRINFEKQQSVMLRNEGLLTEEILRTYTKDTIVYLINEVIQDKSTLGKLNQILNELENTTRVICLNVPVIDETNIYREDDTLSDFILDENTLMEELLDETIYEEPILVDIHQTDQERMIMTNLNHGFCHIGYKIDSGKVVSKSENQDFIISNPNYLIVCDGVGSGLNSKKVSEFTAIQYSTFLESFIYQIQSTNQESRKAFIQQGVYVINHQLQELMKSNYFTDENSGTTLASVIKIANNQYHIANLGDSPVYTFDILGGMHQITYDDTLVNKLSLNISEAEILQVLHKMWPGNSNEQVIRIANQCIVKSFGFKQESVTFNPKNNLTVRVSDTTTFIACSDGISDQFDLNIMNYLMFLGGLKSLIREFNLIKYSKCFNINFLQFEFLEQARLHEIQHFPDIYNIYNSVVRQLFQTYGFYLKEPILEGGIKEVSYEALMNMQNLRLDPNSNPFYGYKIPKSDNISIGFLI